jgi:KaiC/GvpD/RAD55 family RecA-like ATPase
MKKGVTSRVPTGIPGFDPLIEGGIPRSSCVLLAGGPGTGKTIFAMQYLVNGVDKFKDKGLYVSFEQRPEALRSQAGQFGWDLEKLEKSGSLKLLCVPAKNITRKTIDDIRDIVKSKGIKRLVIDSLSTLVVNAPVYSQVNDLALQDVLHDTTIFSPPILGEYVISKFLYGFIDELRELSGCTSILIAEEPQEGKGMTKDTLGEHVCDGVVFINFESLGGNYSRSMIVRKMRETKNNEDVHPVEISKKGIVVHKIED